MLGDITNTLLLFIYIYIYIFIYIYIHTHTFINIGNASGHQSLLKKAPYYMLKRKVYNNLLDYDKAHLPIRLDLLEFQGFIAEESSTFDLFVLIVRSLSINCTCTLSIAQICVCVHI